MSKTLSKILMPITLALSFLASQQVLANCESEVDAAARAQDTRNSACDNASKSLKDKNLKEAKQGDSACKSKEQAYKKAKAKLQACAGNSK